MQVFKPLALLAASAIATAQLSSAETPSIRRLNTEINVKTESSSTNSANAADSMSSMSASSSGVSSAAEETAYGKMSTTENGVEDAYHVTGTDKDTSKSATASSSTSKDKEHDSDDLPKSSKSKSMSGDKEADDDSEEDAGNDYIDTISEESSNEETEDSESNEMDAAYEPTPAAGPPDHATEPPIPPTATGHDDSSNGGYTTPTPKDEDEDEDEDKGNDNDKDKDNDKDEDEDDLEDKGFVTANSSGEFEQYVRKVYKMMTKQNPSGKVGVGFVVFNADEDVDGGEPKDGKHSHSGDSDADADSSTSQTKDDEYDDDDADANGSSIGEEPNAGDDTTDGSMDDPKDSPSVGDVEPAYKDAQDEEDQDEASESAASDASATIKDQEKSPTSTEPSAYTETNERKGDASQSADSSSGSTVDSSSGSSASRNKKRGDY